MAENQIKSMSIKHEAILEYLLVNPAQKLGEVAGYFGVSQTWLSIIIHSDAFQKQLKDRTDELFGATIVPLREKILGVAHVGIEKLGEALENASTASDKDFIASTTDSVLKNLGYSPKSSVVAGDSNTQNNTYFVVNKDDLVKAREKMQGMTNQSGKPALLEGVVNDGKDITASNEVQASGPNREGGILD